MLEKILHGLAECEDFRYVSLRYFNVAGEDPDGELGRTHGDATHLIDRALRAARGRSANLSILGAGFPTPDGSSIRDYIHVTDLARAHVCALERLLETGTSEIFNCGYGHGYSGREVADAARRVTGIDFAVKETGRQPGDPAALFVDASRLRELTGWTARYDDLDYIIGSAWEWESRMHRKAPQECGIGPAREDNNLPRFLPHGKFGGPAAQRGEIGYR
jgi:UDP-glucose 4-epimerase